MDRKIILSLCANVLIAFSAFFSLPILYSIFVLRLPKVAIFFLSIGIFTLAVGIFFSKCGKNHKRKLTPASAAATMLLIYPMLAIFGALPFFLTDWLNPIDAYLETISNLTSAGISILPQNLPFIARLWQSILMWFGSLTFLILLVTLMPEVGGCFGLSLSLHGGQIFSSMFGQMFAMSKKIITVYLILTAISFLLFMVAGLDFANALLMSMRLISTGGGDFFAGRGNIFVEYAAVFTMLLTCGNFLFFYRLIFNFKLPDLKKFFTDSEVKALGLIIFFSVAFITFSLFLQENFEGNRAFRYAIFHVVSFISTSGVSLASIESAHDFDKFLIFLMAFLGGCMGSATGGLKMMRFVVLIKIAAAELQKVMHPHMQINIRVNKNSVPTKIVGRILGFFFLASITLFVCAAILSFTGTTFSEGVAISAACLTTIGNLPGICEPANFINLSIAGKIFCAVILIIGRVEIFALLILLAGLNIKYTHKGKW